MVIHFRVNKRELNYLTHTRVWIIYRENNKALFRAIPILYLREMFHLFKFQQARSPRNRTDRSHVTKQQVLYTVHINIY